MIQKPDIPQEVLHDWQQRIANNDEKAFRLLFNHFIIRLTDFAFSLVQNHEVATEIVDSVFVAVWKNRSALPQVKHLKTYLYTAVKNGSLTYLSKKAHEQITEPFDAINISFQDTANPEQSLISSELYKKIQAAVEALPPRCKMVFKLIREDGLKYKEVAEILNISVKTVDAQLVVAIKKISEKVKAEFEYFPGLIKK